MILVIHAGDKPAEFHADGLTISIPPNQVFEVPAIRGTDHNNNGPIEYLTPPEIVRDLMIARLWSYGLVEVPVIRSSGKFGVKYEFDEEAGIGMAKDLLIKAEEQIVANYVKVCQDRMSQNLPSFPPNGRAREVIEKRRIDLKKEYNIVPIGYGTVAAAAAQGEEMAALRAEVEASRIRNKEMEDKFNRLMAQLGDGETAGKRGK